MKVYLGGIFTVGVLSCLTTYFSPQKEPQNVEELGKKLFNDPLLSADRTISCASCHIPAFAFADTVALSLGVGGKLGTRNTPSVMNMSARPYFFYDGRAETLEEQVFHPIRNPVEMNLQVRDAVKRVQKDAVYRRLFKNIFKNKPDSVNIGQALAAFVRSLESKGDAAADRYLSGGDANAMTPAQRRGRVLFMNKAKCFDCHFSPDFTGDEFKNVGTYNGENMNDVGRFAITKDSADLGKFKVPGLRNITQTAPYMHNGMFRTLEEVIEFYDNPQKIVPDAVNIDTLLQKPLGLTIEEKADLLSFLKALTDRTFVKN